MRIRTIKPDIWRSEDFASLSDFGQLMFIGLINYVDDNGVGRYNIVDFAADVFASRLASNPAELLPKITEVFGNLSDRGMVQIYDAEINGKTGRYVYLTNWDRHQKISHPMKPRFPRPSNDFTSLPKSSEDFGNSPKPTENFLPEEGKSGRREQGKSRRVEKETLPIGREKKAESDSRSSEGIDPASAFVEAQLIPDNDSNMTIPASTTPVNPEKKSSGKRKASRSTPDEAHWRYARAREIPDEWMPTPRNRQVADELGLDCDMIAVQFADWCRAKGTKYKNFEAAFNNWLRRETKPGYGNASNRSKSESNLEHNMRFVQQVHERVQREREAGLLPGEENLDIR